LTVDEALKGVSDGGAAVVRGALGGETARVEDAWRWTPVAGDSLLLLALCDAQGCGIAALHTDGASLSVRLRERTGPHPPGAVRDNDAAVLWVHPHAGPKVPVRILHYREGRVLLRRPQDVVHRAD
jgi:hypothetical protein